MRRASITAAIGTVLAALALPTAAQAAPAPGVSTTEYVVVYKDGVNAQSKAAQVHVTPDFVYRYALSGFAAPLTDAQRTRVAADPQVLMVTTADRAQVPARAGQPTQQPPQVVPHGIKRIGTLASPTAAIDGSDQRMDVDVAVLDTGIDRTHPDLNVAGGVDCIGDGHGFTDVHGHGTMVAGVIGARDNAIGVVGVAPGVRLWSVRVLNAENSTTDANLLCGLDWVQAQADKIDVANLSLSDTGSDDHACGLANHDPLHWAICHVASDGRVTLVAAAGNDSTDARSTVPAAYDEVITVSALADSDGASGSAGGPTCLGDPDDSFASFSNYGPGIDLAAPGECVGSTYPGGLYALDSGTSYAAPHVTGAAALYLARHPGASPTEVRAALIQRREQIHLPGDPDGIDEGVVNVAGL